MTDQEFAELVRAEAGKLFRVAWGILGQESDAWDALQEATLAAYRARHQLRGGPEAFPAWYRRVLINRCLNMLRSRSRVVPAAPDTRPEPDPLPGLEGHAEDLALWEAVAELEPDKRQVVMLRYLADLSTAEVASALNIPEGTVKSRLHRALRQLRERLGHEGRDAL